jgi:DNA topoisomerase-1
MSPAKIEETEFDIRAGRYIFKAKGEVVQFDGFQALYPKKEKEDKRMPAAQAGETLSLKQLDSKQNFTQPPPRYTEGSLVKELEARGIGRPSTYVPIISTLLNRDYVSKEEGKFVPRELGVFVTDYLIANFPDLMQFEFTAQLEEELDRISEGRLDWVEYLRSYNSLLERDLDSAEKTESIKPKGIPSDETCPECGRPLVIKEGRFGRFKACTGYPECSYKAGLDKKKAARPLDENCPECGSQLVERQGRYGPFIACSNYPKCRYIKSEKVDTGIQCPECREGTILRKKTRKGKTFFGCSGYPKCRFATWDAPVARACPECGRAFLLKKSPAKSKPYIYCGSESCSYREEIKEEESPDPAS